MRKAITDYDMIQPGDKIAVGVSGGKDSMALLLTLNRLKKYLGIPFEIVGITLDPQFKGIETDYSKIEEICKEHEIEYHIKRTEIGTIIFDERNESNPCSLCARMRRGSLHDLTKELGCNKIALGHHYDDAVETFIMNLFNEGRIGNFSPVTYLSRKDITMIRPMVYAPETIIQSVVTRHDIPIVKSICPVDGITNRQWTKDFLKDMEAKDKGFKERIFGAMKRAHVSNW